MRVEMRLNGAARAIDVTPNELLLDVLRERLGLTGAKRSCDVQVCGTCTVLVDGAPVSSCTYLAAEADGHEVTTIEGLSTTGDHPLQRAWVELGVPQCGFCQAGQLMTAAALLAEIPKPTDDDIDHSLAGNLCRCGTYVRIRAAVHRAAGSK